MYFDYEMTHVAARGGASRSRSGGPLGIFWFMGSTQKLGVVALQSWALVVAAAAAPCCRL